MKSKLKALPWRSIVPHDGVAKWCGIIRWPVPACFSISALRRYARHPCRNRAGRKIREHQLHRMMNHVADHDAPSAVQFRFTTTCPGEWPSQARTRCRGPIRNRPRPARPSARMIGSTLSSNAMAWMLLGLPSPWRRGIPIVVLALGHDVLGVGEGRHPRPSTSRVFQPTWSQCRCVHMTCVTSSGLTPSAASPPSQSAGRS